MKSVIRTFASACLVFYSAGALAGGLNATREDLLAVFLLDSDQTKIRSGFAFADPQLQLSNARGVNTSPRTGPRAATGSTSTTSEFDVFLPYAVARHNVSPDFACVAAWNTPYFARAKPGTQWAGRYVSDVLSLSSTGLEAMCAYGIRGIGPGRLSLIGDLRMADLNLGAAQLGPNYTNLRYANSGGRLAEVPTSGRYRSSFEPGYRAGLAYEIPEARMRLGVLYSSGIAFHATGTKLYSFTGADGLPAPYVDKGYVNLKMPDSVNVFGQIGLPFFGGIVAFGNVKWENWHKWRNIDVMSYDPTVPLGRSVINWKDGWTVEGGLAKPLTEKLLGIVSLQWDRAVGREVPERYSLLFNAKYKMTSQIDIDCGVGVAIRKGVKDASQNFMTAVVTYDLKGGADLILNTALTYSF